MVTVFLLRDTAPPGTFQKLEYSYAVSCSDFLKPQIVLGAVSGPLHFFNYHQARIF
jgi:hypothetical protein